MGIPLRKGIIDLYLHQLSARLLGWRRSCDPPAIVLELPAGNNQSHCYSRSCPHQFNSWTEDPNYALNALREVQSRNLKRTIGSLKEYSGRRKWSLNGNGQVIHFCLEDMLNSDIYTHYSYSYMVKLNNYRNRNFMHCIYFLKDINS